MAGRAFIDDYSPEWIATEVIVVVDDLEVAGTTDWVARINGKVIIGDWKNEYNHDRRHSSLGYIAPADYARQCTHRIETDDSHTVRT